jgi:alanyl-tRNA synthetase
VSTERLYYTDSYLTRFEGTVQGRAEDGRRIVLDRTAFYPTSGGQPHDLGTLNGIPVLDVLDEGETIVHRLAAPLAADHVAGEVDWSRRFDHMQQHTGQHLLSAVLEELFGYRTVSVHFGAVYATLDLDAGALPPDQVRQAEARANAIVAENRPLSVAFEEAATASGLRKASEREGLLRIVTIQGLDRSACGGTHVRATGEVGPIVVRGVERVKQQVRLEFRCGGRAVARARADFDLLSGIAAHCSAGIDDLAAVLEKQRGDLSAAQAERRKLEEALHGYRAGELYHAAAPDAAGRRTILLAETGSLESLRGLAQALIARPGVLVVGTLASPPTVLLATSADTGVDAGARLKPLLAEVGGRGGGSARVAQGTAPSSDLLAQVVRTLAG